MDIDTIERAALRAWSAAIQQPIGGWLAQYHYGQAGRRINSVTALAWHDDDDLARQITAAEAFYHACGAACVFRLNAASQPADLDAVLASRGYRHTPGAHVLQRPVIAGEHPAAPPLADVPLDDWLALHETCSGQAARDHVAHREVLQRISAPHLRAVLHDGAGAPLACAIAVLDGAAVGIFDVVVDHARRGHGHGRHLMAGLLAWAEQHGAGTCYLQVDEANLVARRLYHALGFNERYRYWYRTGRNQ
jgi:GNAT superfamily N-acetyltransferase